MQTDGAAVACHQFSQVHNLLFRAFAGVRRRVEIHSVNLYTAFCDHIAGHRAVNAAGQKKHGSAAGAHRHAAGPRDHLGIQIYLIPDLHMDKHIRFVHIHFHIGAGIQDLSAQLRIQFHGIHGITLFRSPHIHLKGHGLITVNLLCVGYNGLRQLLVSLVLKHNSRTDAEDTEHPLQRLHSLLIIIFSPGKHIDPAPLLHHVKFSIHAL